MSDFEPVHDAHAIEQVAIIVQFAAMQDDTHFSRILEITAPLQSQLPRLSDIPGIPFFSQPFGLVGTPPAFPLMNPSMVAGGRSFSKFREDGSLESELRIDRASVGYRTSAYTTWRELWRKAGEYFDKIIPMYTISAPFHSMSLNYLDKFYWNGNPAEARGAQLLRPGADFVAPHVFGLEDLWHSHTGAFLAADKETKRLVVVNLDCVDENRNGVNRRTVAIATILTDMFNQPGYVPKTLSVAESVNFFGEHMQLLHNHSKDIFGRTINDNMCKRIGLVPAAQEA